VRLDDCVDRVPRNTARRHVVERLLREGSTTVPAGLVERAPQAARPVSYRLRPGELAPTASWIEGAAAAWDARLGRLKDWAERPGQR
jgi:hypothetical protein